MATATHTDLDGLRDKLSSMLAEDRDAEVLTLVVELVSKLTSDNRRLAEQLATFMRGRAKGGSERISSDQLLLFLSQLDHVPESPLDPEPSA